MVSLISFVLLTFHFLHRSYIYSQFRNPFFSVTVTFFFFFSSLPLLLSRHKHLFLIHSYFSTHTHITSPATTTVSIGPGPICPPIPPPISPKTWHAAARACFEEVSRFRSHSYIVSYYGHTYPYCS
ncbi:hypothetical protein CPB86DRAFT_402270 [Serendipita vermifera]|nr:hypothetical protein CPB86DRAFT_402270 [Serendipita vermifera]